MRGKNGSVFQSLRVFQPVSNWNKGKKEEFKERKTFVVKKNMKIKI